MRAIAPVMRVLLLPLLLAGCGSGAPEPANVAVPSSGAPTRTAQFTVDPLTAAEIQNANLAAPVCTWRRTGETAPLMATYATDGLIKLNGRLIRLRHDVPASETAMDAVGNYVGEGISARAERLPGSQPTPADQESVTRPAELVVTRGDQTVRIGPGELLCGS